MKKLGDVIFYRGHAGLKRVFLLPVIFCFVTSNSGSMEIMEKKYWLVSRIGMK